MRYHFAFMNRSWQLAQVHLLVQLSRPEADSFSMNGIIMRHKVRFSIFASSGEEDIEKRFSSIDCWPSSYSLGHLFTKEQIINE